MGAAYPPVIQDVLGTGPPRGTEGHQRATEKTPRGCRETPKGTEGPPGWKYVTNQGRKVGEGEIVLQEIPVEIILCHCGLWINHLKQNGGLQKQVHLRASV